MTETKECPTCGRDDFASERGVQLHHARVHDESLVTDTQECEYCGGEYTLYESHKPSRFCSQECKSNAARVDRTCEHCGEVFSVYKCNLSQGRGRFCSKDCNSNHMTGENNQSWKDARVDRTCEHCGETFTRYKSNVGEGDGRFCSRECKHSHLVGENASNWKGGERDRIDYGPMWNEERREFIREQQGRECAGCGVGEEELGRRLDVHHIRPARPTDDLTQNQIWNLVALCNSCHQKYEHTDPVRQQLEFGKHAMRAV